MSKASSFSYLIPVLAVLKASLAGAKAKKILIDATKASGPPVTDPSKWDAFLGSANDMAANIFARAQELLATIGASSYWLSIKPYLQSYLESTWWWLKYFPPGAIWAVIAIGVIYVFHEMKTRKKNRFFGGLFWGILKFVNLPFTILYKIWEFFRYADDKDGARLWYEEIVKEGGAGSAVRDESQSIADISKILDDIPPPDIETLDAASLDRMHEIATKQDKKMTPKLMSGVLTNKNL